MRRPLILEEVFQRRIANADIGTQEDIKNCERFCRDENIELCIAKVPYVGIKDIHCLEAIGYRLMGATLTYSKKVKSKFPLYEGAEVMLRPAKPSEFEYTMSCVARAFGENFTHDHYYVDERLEPERCVRLVQRYVKESWERGIVLIAERPAAGKPSGLLTVRKNSETEYEVLLGAFPALPLGEVRMICSKVVLWARERGARTLKVSTELSNLSMQRGLVQTGFSAISAHYTFHKWFS